MSEHVCMCGGGLNLTMAEQNKSSQSLTLPSLWLVLLHKQVYTKHYGLINGYCLVNLLSVLFRSNYTSSYQVLE